MNKKNYDVIVFFRRDTRKLETQKMVMSKWMQINELDFPMMIDEKFIFEKNDIKNTSLMFIDERNQVYIYIGEFPLGKEGENKLADIFENLK